MAWDKKLTNTPIWNGIRNSLTLLHMVHVPMVLDTKLMNTPTWDYVPMTWNKKPTNTPTWNRIKKKLTNTPTWNRITRNSLTLLHGIMCQWHWMQNSHEHFYMKWDKKKLSPTLPHETMRNSLTLLHWDNVLMTLGCETLMNTPT